MVECAQCVQATRAPREGTPSDWSLALCCEPPHNHGEKFYERILAAFHANTQRSQDLTRR